MVGSYSFEREQDHGGPADKSDCILSIVLRRIAFVESVLFTTLIRFALYHFAVIEMWFGEGRAQDSNLKRSQKDIRTVVFPKGAWAAAQAAAHTFVMLQAFSGETAHTLESSLPVSLQNFSLVKEGSCRAWQ